MQVEYHKDGRFQSHDLTSWPKISEMFLNNLPKMEENANIDWVMHPKLDWEYVTTLLEKIGELLWPTHQPFMQMENYVLFVAAHLDQKEDGFWAFTNTCTIRNA